MRYIYTSTIPSTRLVPRVSCVVEASIEVIDDLQGEAQEIAQAGNTFITYGPPMQLARVCIRPYRRPFVIMFTSSHAYVTSTH